MNITLFAHILNEEILLPHWLNHHKRLFTHGVILDVGCTDRSMDIVHTICPTWEIIKVKPGEHLHPYLDINLIEYHESRFSGWKITLNVTEFLIIDNLQEYLTHHNDKIGFQCTGLISVDSTPSINIDLYNRNYGYIEKNNSWDFNYRGIHIDNNGNIHKTWNTIPGEFVGYRNRLIHQNIKGEYGGGRHTNRLTNDIHNDIYILWIARAAPILQNSRCIGWLSNRNAIFCQDTSDFDTFSNLNVCMHFWESECKKSYNLSLRLPLFKKYMEYHKSNLCEKELIHY